MTAHTSRRSALRTVAAGATGLLSLAGAGCVELLPPLGQRVQFGRVDAPAGAPPEYRQWVPTSSAFETDGQRSEQSVLVSTPATDGADVVGAPLQFGRSMVTALTDYFGIGIEHYGRATRVGGTTVLEGPVDPDAVRETLRPTGYEPAGTYRDYQLFARDDHQRTAAVADGRIVHGAGAHTRTDVEAVIDAGEGYVDRRHEHDREFDAVTSRLGQRPFLFGGVGGLFETSPAATFGLNALDFDDTAVYALTIERYEDGVDVPVEEIRSELASQQSALLSTAVDLQVDGQFAIVESRLGHEQYRRELSEQYPPHVTWGVEAESDRLVLRHEAGETVAASELTVGTKFDQPIDRQFTDEYDVVTPGDVLSVDRAAFEEPALVLTWNDPDSHDRSTLFRYELS